MFELLEKLRAKPDGVKKQIAALSALFVVGLLFVVWLSVWYPAIIGETSQSQISEESSPLSNFTQMLSVGVSTIQDSVSQIKNTVNSLGTSTEHVSNDPIR